MVSSLDEVHLEGSIDEGVMTLNLLIQSVQIIQLALATN